MAVGGGLPLFHDKKLIGGIGVSGGSHEQDQQAASAALGSLGFEIDARVWPRRHDLCHHDSFLLDGVVESSEEYWLSFLDPH